SSRSTARNRLRSHHTPAHAATTTASTNASTRTSATLRTAPSTPNAAASRSRIRTSVATGSSYSAREPQDAPGHRGRALKRDVVDPVDPLEAHEPSDPPDDARGADLLTHELRGVRRVRGRPDAQHERRDPHPPQEVDGVLGPERVQDPQVVGAREPRVDAALRVHAHEREEHRLDLGRDLQDLVQPDAQT